MGTIASQARLTTIRGQRVPDDDAGKNCRAVWEKVLSEARAQNDPYLADGGIRTLFAMRGAQATNVPPEGTPGLQWKGALSRVVRDLWPGVQPDNGDGETLQREINLYLMHTGNLVCTHKGGVTGLSTWWLRQEWSGRQPPEWWKTKRSEGGRSAADARAAARAAEREDVKLRIRQVPPGPVQTSYMCQWPKCAQRFNSALGRTKHWLAAHRTMEEAITEALRWIGEPASSGAITSVMEAGSYPGSSSYVSAGLTEMLEAGKLVLVEPTVYAFAGTPLEGGLRCREPGCGEILEDMLTRGHHEEKAHPGSEARVVRCLCGDREYTASSMASHVGRSKTGRHGTVPLPCRGGCEKEFTQHLGRVFHEDREHPEAPGRTETCECGQRFFPGTADLARHRFIAGHKEPEGERLEKAMQGTAPLVTPVVFKPPAPEATPQVRGPVAPTPVQIAEQAVRKAAELQRQLDAMGAGRPAPAEDQPPAEVLRRFLADYDAMKAERDQAQADLEREKARNARREQLLAELRELDK